MDIGIDQEAVAALTADSSLASFLAVINNMLDRGDHERLSEDSDPFELCDSLELVSISLYLESLGAEIPPGMEASIDSLADVHQHVLRRLGLVA